MYSYTSFSNIRKLWKNRGTIKKLKEAHFKRIELSDAILVINKDNYIGNSTNLEIEYARKLEKEIIYYTDFIKEN